MTLLYRKVTLQVLQRGTESALKTCMHAKFYTRHACYLIINNTTQAQLIFYKYFSVLGTTSFTCVPNFVSFPGRRSVFSQLSFAELHQAKALGIFQLDLIYIYHAAYSSYTKLYCMTIYLQDEALHASLLGQRRLFEVSGLTQVATFLVHGALPPCVCLGIGFRTGTWRLLTLLNFHTCMQNP